MDPEVIVLSDDDDDRTETDDVYKDATNVVEPPHSGLKHHCAPPSLPPPPPPPTGPKPKIVVNRLTFDMPCPKSKKKRYDPGNTRRDDGACAKPASTGAKPAAVAANLAATVATRPSTAAATAKSLAAAARSGTGGVNTAANPRRKYPPPYPKVPPHARKQPSWKNVPPAPTLRLVRCGTDGAVQMAWEMRGTVAHQTWAEVKAFEMYVCRESDRPPDASMWKLVDDRIAGRPLPEGCVIDCPPGVHHFALRAVDVHDRRAPFSVLKVTI